MEVQAKCLQIFSEINALNSRLAVLGREAKPILGEMLNSGVPHDSITTLLAQARKAERADIVEEIDQQKEKDRRRCKWWNRGYCREKDSCSYSHPTGDCAEHLQGRCTRRGCTSLRHRKVCKFLSSEAGCLRGETCEYLHPQEVEKVVEEKAEEQKSEIDKKEAIPKETQTENIFNNRCICNEAVVTNRLLVKEDRIVCSFKKADLSEDDWEDIEDTVKQSEVDLDDMLEEYSKVMEGYWRIEKKDKNVNE
jgi:hypothetical protein